MENNKPSQVKYNIAWASVVVIFIGAVVYIPLMYFSNREPDIVYKNKPVFIPIYINSPSLDTSEANSQTIENNSTIKKEQILTKELRVGDTDPEVKILQQYLNQNGFIVSENGPGSPGKETDLFGRKTKDALIRFQEANKESILTPQGLNYGTGYLDRSTINFINL